MKKRTILDQVTLRADGFVEVRFAKQIVDGEEILANEWHRTSLQPDTKVKDQMHAVNAHLELMNYPPVSAADIATIEKYVSVSRGK